MAYVKKSATTEKVAEDKTQEEQEVQKETKAKSEPKAKKRKFEQDEGIPCVSVTEGFLGMTGIKTNINYSWDMNGDVTDVEYQDLVAAVRSKKSYVFSPYFLIQDNDFVEEFPELKRFYSKMYTVRDIEELFKLPPTDMKANIEKLPDGIKESIKTLASTKIANGTLDSIKRIKILDEIFGTKLMLLSELF